MHACTRAHKRTHFALLTFFYNNILIHKGIAASVGYKRSSALPYGANLKASDADDLRTRLSSKKGLTKSLVETGNGLQSKLAKKRGVAANPNNDAAKDGSKDQEKLQGKEGMFKVACNLCCHIISESLQMEWIATGAHNHSSKCTHGKQTAMEAHKKIAVQCLLCFSPVRFDLVPAQFKHNVKSHYGANAHKEAKTLKPKKVQKDVLESKSDNTQKQAPELVGFNVGDRVHVEKYCAGTLRWQGTFQPKAGGSGQYRLGIELDSPLGLNDGGAGDKRYFSCRKNYGVFVVPRKCKRLIVETIDDDSSAASSSDSVIEILNPEDGSNAAVERIGRESKRSRLDASKRADSAMDRDGGNQTLTAATLRNHEQVDAAASDLVAFLMNENEVAKRNGMKVSELKTSFFESHPEHKAMLEEGKLEAMCNGTKSLKWYVHEGVSAIFWIAKKRSLSRSPSPARARTSHKRHSPSRKSPMLSSSQPEGSSTLLPLKRSPDRDDGGTTMCGDAAASLHSPGAKLLPKTPGKPPSVDGLVLSGHYLRPRVVTESTVGSPKVSFTMALPQARRATFISDLNEGNIMAETGVTAFYKEPGHIELQGTSQQVQHARRYILWFATSKHGRNPPDYLMSSTERIYTFQCELTQNSTRKIVGKGGAMIKLISQHSECQMQFKDEEDRYSKKRTAIELSGTQVRHYPTGI